MTMGLIFVVPCRFWRGVSFLARRVSRHKDCPAFVFHCITFHLCPIHDFHPPVLLSLCPLALPPSFLSIPHNLSPFIPHLYISFTIFSSVLHVIEHSTTAQPYPSFIYKKEGVSLPSVKLLCQSVCRLLYFCLVSQPL